MDDKALLIRQVGMIIGGESDRGVVLLVAEMLNDRIERLLGHYLHMNKRRRKMFFSFAGPLGSFGARVEFAHALGLIEDWAYDCLTAIRRLRNTFAHSTDLATFSTEEARSTCNTLLMSHPRFRMSLEEKETNEQVRGWFSLVALSILKVIEDTQSNLKAISSGQLAAKLEATNSSPTPSTPNDPSNNESRPTQRPSG